MNPHNFTIEETYDYFYTTVFIMSQWRLRVNIIILWAVLLTGNRGNSQGMVMERKMHRCTKYVIQNPTTAWFVLCKSR